MSYAGTNPETLTFDEFAARYCDRQVSTPDELRETLREQRVRYSPTGWVLLECVILDSSRLGSYVVVPYGPNNSLKDVPTRPLSPRGLASDMSTVAAVLLADEVSADE